MTEAQQREIYLLRKHLGMSAREAYHRTPVWELDVLRKYLSEELAASEEG